MIALYFVADTANSFVRHKYQLLTLSLITQII